MPGQEFGNVTGLSLILLGIVIVTLAALRFLRTANSIDSAALQPKAGSQVDLLLAVLLVLLGCALFFYLSETVVLNASPS